MICRAWRWRTRKSFWTARAVEVSGFDGQQICEDFVKSMKPGGLGGHGGTPALLYVRERYGIMARRGAVGGGVDHA